MQAGRVQNFPIRNKNRAKIPDNPEHCGDQRLEPGGGLPSAPASPVPTERQEIEGKVERTDQPGMRSVRDIRVTDLHARLSFRKLRLNTLPAQQEDTFILTLPEQLTPLPGAEGKMYNVM